MEVCIYQWNEFKHNAHVVLLKLLANPLNTLPPKSCRYHSDEMTQLVIMNLVGSGLYSKCIQCFSQSVGPS